MSFFKRNDPSAPAARRAAQGAPAGSPYERLPPDNSSYTSQPPQSHPGLPPRRPPPPQQPDFSAPAAYSSPPRQQAQPQYGGYDPNQGGGDYREKAEYRPARVATPQRGYPGSGAQGVSTGSGRGVFNIAPCPSDPLALTNRLVVSGGDFPPEVEFVIIRNRFILSIIRDPTGTLPPKHLGPSKIIRQWIGLSAVGETVECEPYAPGNGEWASSVELEVSFRLKRKETSDLFDCEDMAAAFIAAFPSLPVTPLQPLVFDYRGHELKATVRTVSTLDGAEGQTGVIMEGTEVLWVKDPTSGMKLKNTSKNRPTNAILAPNFKFEDMGIGGLDTEFAAIFRRAFASRIFPPGLVDKLGIQHVKGILLFGPPGTGKTLMARQIGKMLNAREPKIVNGPEILNKFVGQSEENIRKLFADAEKEQKEKGDESGLHIIIFDELDAICKQRGSTNNGTGVGDSVVNQLLSKMDGVDQLNNVLIIGMTNRLDMIDEALLRPGRLEVHVEISLPDEAGRFQILNIHTSKMRNNGVMADDVDLAELAALTKNFSGAEIGGLVKSATSFAFNRHVKVGSVAAFEDVENIKIGRADFMHALDEVQAAFGVSEEELQQVVQNGIIHYSQRINDILKDGSLLVEQVRNSARTPLVSALIHGPSGSGKTALAATIAMASDFPFIKLISPESMVGFSEAQKIAQLHKIFSDSYKSPLSVVVVDSIERLLDWNPIGPRFSNGVLQALVVLFGKRPPKERRLLILATTSNRAILQDMDVLSAFDTDITVTPIDTLEAVDHCLREVGLFASPSQHQQAMQMLRDARLGEEGKGELLVGVKKLLSMAEMARQDPDPVYKMVSSLVRERLRSQNPSLGIAKLLVQLKIEQPGWAVSEKRLRKILQALPGGADAANGKHQAASGETVLVAETGLDPTIDVAHIAPKVKVKMFGGGKGKGLVAKEKILQGDVLWQEEPWIATADPNMYPYLRAQRMCTQCLTIFSRPNPPLSAPCPHCDTAHFCNRLCLSRAQASASHHDLLCPGQNPAAKDLLKFVHAQGARHLDAVAKIIALWRGERELGQKGKAKELEQRVWHGMARINQERKEAERREWSFVAENRHQEWRAALDLLTRVLNPAPEAANFKSFQRLIGGSRRSRLEPLSAEEENRWFSYESFLELLGTVGINQEASGGLYALHAHLNHSCEPNLQVRNLPKSFAPPDPTALPCDLPSPNPSGVRGTNRLTLLARRTIQPGEELCISYVNFALTRAERRQALREEYGFWCSCPKCLREKKTDEQVVTQGADFAQV
ncbi:Vesicular-fusion protein SEC18 [Saitozyma sp. JCM 24511]|nr:Vesicular-fusion protein SEC18 [Saitozyma sp. JCM 24511]